MTQVANPIPDLCIGPPPEIIKNELITPVVNEVEETKITLEEPPQAQPTWLSELQTVDRLLISRRLGVRGAVTLRGKKNRFEVKTDDQTLVYHVEEANKWWVGYLLYGLRPLQLTVSSPNGVEVLKMIRPYACTTRVLPCQLQRMQVLDPGSRVLGSVQQVWTAVQPMYVVKDRDGESLFCIRGPAVTLNWFSSQKFRISRLPAPPPPPGIPAEDSGGEVVGGVYKEWEGLWHALFAAPVRERFGVNFGKSLTVEEKALLLAATLLIDYMYFDV